MLILKACPIDFVTDFISLGKTLKLAKKAIDDTTAIDRILTRSPSDVKLIADML